MKKLLFLIILTLSFISCSVSQDLPNYSYDNQQVLDNSDTIINYNFYNYETNYYDYDDYWNYSYLPYFYFSLYNPSYRYINYNWYYYYYPYSLYNPYYWMYRYNHWYWNNYWYWDRYYYGNYSHNHNYRHDNQYYGPRKERTNHYVDKNQQRNDRTNLNKNNNNVRTYVPNRYSKLRSPNDYKVPNPKLVKPSNDRIPIDKNKINDDREKNIRKDNDENYSYPKRNTPSLNIENKSKNDIRKNNNNLNNDIKSKKEYSSPVKTPSKTYYNKPVERYSPKKSYTQPSQPTKPKTHYNSPGVNSKNNNYSAPKNPPINKNYSNPIRQSSPSKNYSTPSKTYPSNRGNSNPRK